MRIDHHYPVLLQGSTNNATCFIGPHRTWHAGNDSFSNLIPGQGHWGPDARPGDVRFRFPFEPLVRSTPPSLSPLTKLFVVQARWRRGESISLVSAREAMMSYEQLA